MRFLALAFLLVLALQVAYAADSLTFDNCEDLGIQNCDEFKELNITIDEQKKLFSSLLEIKNNMNMHNFIYDWNTNLVFDEIPYTVLPMNYKTIRDAWLALTCVMPSVLYSNKLYNNYSGDVQANYDYTLTLPPTYFNGAWDLCTNSPPTSSNEGEAGDCRTEYPENWDISFLNVYLNNNWIGNVTLVSFNTTNLTNNFESILNIVNKIKREHFRWRQGSCCLANYCCWPDGRGTRCGRDLGKCGCETYWQNCQYYGTDFRYDSMILKDNKTSYLEQIDYSDPIILYDEAKSKAYFIINATNLEHYELNIGEFELIKNNLRYSYNYSYLPTNVLTAKADYSPEIDANVYSVLEERNNTDLIKFYLLNHSENCKLTLFSYFNSLSIDCILTILPKTELNISTDKFFYMPNETIKANISIKSEADTSKDIIKVRYGNNSIDINGSTILEITPLANVNRISAEYETDFSKQSASAAKTISVYAGEKPRLYVNLFWFVIFFLLFASAMRMCWIKFYGVKND